MVYDDGASKSKRAFAIAMLCNVHYHADIAENQSLYFSCKLSVNRIIWSDHSLDDDRTCTRYNTDGRHILSIGIIYDFNLKIKHQQKRCKKKQFILSHPAHSLDEQPF